MKILIPIVETLKGGIDRVSYSLTENFSNFVEVVVVGSNNRISEFRKNIKSTSRISYENINWPKGDWRKYINALVRRMKLLAIKSKLKSFYKISDKIEKTMFNLRINELSNKYKATLCLFLFSNQTAPNVKIPIAIVLHDLNKFNKQKEKILKKWLEKSKIVFTISKKNQKELSRIFQSYKSKIKVIPWASKIPKISKPFGKNQVPVFYYPGSTTSYKNHIIVLKAASKLAKKNIKFKIIFTGFNTDKLIGDIESSFEEECRQFYKSNENLLKSHIEALGYCTYKKVEEIYQKCSYVILPSSFEGFGLPLTEAVLRGIPVICSNLDVFKEQIELYDCSDMVEIFPVNDYTKLARLMEKAIMTPKKHLLYRERIKRFSHWTWEDVAKKYVEELSKIES